VLKSCFCDFEELLLNDGCTGCRHFYSGPLEVQFDEHKLLVAYAATWSRSSASSGSGAWANVKLKLITEGEHLQVRSRTTSTLPATLPALGVGELAEQRQQL
jgi:hypothetical protein